MIMLARPKLCLCLIFSAVACGDPLSAEIVEIREYHGKQVMCGYSGLIGVAKACGTEEFARVFTGIVRSAVGVGDTDKLLEIIPDEVFVGDASAVTAITDQACLRTDIQLETSGSSTFNVTQTRNKTAITSR